MALSFTFTGDHTSVEGPRRKMRGTLAFDSSYAAGGESLTPAAVGMRVIEQLQTEPTNGYYFEYDITNQLLKAFKSQSSGVIDVSTTRTLNDSGGTTEALYNYSLPASTLSATGMGIRMKAWGYVLNDSTVKQIRAIFGSHIVVSGNIVGSTAVSWNAETIVVRTGAATQSAYGTMTLAFPQGASNTGCSANIQWNAPAMTLSSAQAVGISVSGNANQITQEGQLTELFAAQGTGTVGIEVPNAADLSGLTGVNFTAIGF